MKEENIKERIPYGTAKEAVNYGAASNKIENNYLTDKEWNELVEAIMNNHDKSLIEEIVKKVRSKKNGKF